MSLPWMWSAYSTTAGDAETNAPSLWSGGIKWSGSAPEKGYWQSSANPTDRTGSPDISIAIGGRLVSNTISSASWTLGRQEWLGVLAPGMAAFSVEGSVSFDPMDEVVIGVMSTVTDQHSASLWVGYAETVSETTEKGERTTTSVSCVDVVGRLGQAPAPSSGYPIYLNPTLADHIERIASEAGTFVYVVDDSLYATEVFAFSFEAGETALAAINRLEAQVNANVFLRGDGRLVVSRRWYQAAPDLDPAPTPADLSGASAPARWTTSLSPTTVVNDWGDLFATSSAQEASRARYGRRSGTAQDTAGWLVIVDETSLLLSPRRLLDGSETPITDLSHPALFLDPGDWADLDGTTYQVLSVSHQVELGRRWAVTVTGDSAQPTLHQEFE